MSTPPTTKKQKVQTREQNNVEKVAKALTKPAASEEHG
jgi:hypothetical protein